jgi:hypothetical protein
MRLSQVTLMVSIFGLLGTAITPAVRSAKSDPIRALLWGRKDVFGSSYPNLVDAPLYPGLVPHGSDEFLIQGESHAQLMKLLDDLLAKDVELIAPDLRQRALMQSELWQVFDYTYVYRQTPDEPARIELRKKLVPAIRKLALTKTQILALPVNLIPSNDSDAPPDVEDPHSGWVGRGDVDRKLITDERALIEREDSVIAPGHAEACDQRSVFGVFVWFPTGQAAVQDFVRNMSTHLAATRPATEPAPQFPVGAKVALLRRMILIDSEGEPVCSPIVQSLQVRTFLKIGTHEFSRALDTQTQEFVLDADGYCAGRSNAMHPIGLLEYIPMGLFERPILSPFEDYHLGPPPPAFRLTHPRLQECYICHGSPGISSMRSFSGLFNGTVNAKPYPATFDREIELTIQQKQRTAKWGMLQGYWESLPR